MMPEEVAQDPRAYLVARTVPTARSVGITTAPLVLAGSPSAGRPRARVVASRRSVGRSVLVALGGLLLAISGPTDGTAAERHEVAKLIPANLLPEDQVGRRLALGGDTAVLGPGAAWVFEEDEAGSWNEGPTLEDTGDVWDVDVEGDWLAVGSPLDDTAGEAAGAVYLYRRAGEGWEFIKQVLASDAEEGRLFGRAVALSGDRLMVGAPADDPLLRRGGGDPYEGASYLFERDAGGSDNWGEVAKLVGDRRERQGYNVALYGETAVSAAFGIGAGVVYVFERDAGGQGAWGRTLEIDRFARDVDLHEDTLIVGESPDVDIWQRDETGVWSLTALLEGDVPGFGEAVAIGTGVALVASPHVGGSRGRVHVFGRNADGAGAWGVLEILTASDGVGGDELGRWVDLDGSRALVGACNDDPEVGAPQRDDPEARTHFWCRAQPHEGSGSAYLFKLNDLDLSVRGDCPGDVTVILTGARPGAPVAFAASPEAGSFRLGGDVCPGTILDVGRPAAAHIAFAGPSGEVRFELTAPPSACGALLQAVALEACYTSPVVGLP